MLTFKNGLTFLHHSGKVWIDETTFADVAEFFAASHYSEVLWKDAPAGWGSRFA